MRGVGAHRELDVSAQSSELMRTSPFPPLFIQSWTVAKSGYQMQEKSTAILGGVRILMFSRSTSPRSGSLTKIGGHCEISLRANGIDCFDSDAAFRRLRRCRGRDRSDEL